MINNQLIIQIMDQKDSDIRDTPIGGTEQQNLRKFLGTVDIPLKTSNMQFLIPKVPKSQLLKIRIGTLVLQIVISSISRRNCKKLKII